MAGGEKKEEDIRENNSLTNAAGEILPKKELHENGQRARYGREELNAGFAGGVY